MQREYSSSIMSRLLKSSDAADANAVSQHHPSLCALTETNCSMRQPQVNDLQNYHLFSKQRKTTHFICGGIESEERDLRQIFSCKQSAVYKYLTATDALIRFFITSNMNCTVFVYWLEIDSSFILI